MPAPKFKKIGAMPLSAEFVLTPTLREYAMFHLGCEAAEIGDHWEEFLSFHAARGSLFKDWGKAWMNRILQIKTQRTRQARMQPMAREKALSFEERLAKAKLRLNR